MIKGFTILAIFGVMYGTSSYGTWHDIQTSADNCVRQLNAVTMTWNMSCGG